MESISHQYTVAVNWLADRKGLLSSPELNSKIEVVTPPQFPKGIEGIWSPEHLFVAAINSCLMTTFLSIAENSKLNFVSFESNAVGKLEMQEGKYIMSEVELKPLLKIEDGAMFEKAERVLKKSETNCLISNSVKSKIIFTPVIVLKTLV